MERKTPGDPSPLDENNFMDLDDISAKKDAHLASSFVGRHVNKT